MDDTSLDDILNSEAEAAPTPEIEATPSEQSERQRDEQGRFVAAEPSGEPEAVAPPPEAAPPAAQQEADQGHIPVAALRDERQKRQQLEQQLQQYEAYFSQLQQQPQQEQVVPDMYTDPQGYTEWVAGQVEARIMQQVQNYGNTFDVQMNGKVSERLARQRYADYDEVIDASFAEAVAANPMLKQQLVQQDDPAEYAYRVGKQWADAKQFGTTAPVSRDDLKAEIRAELMAELSLSPKPTAPSSLASERSVGSRSGPAWSGPAPIGDILNR